jgi:CheY-like chemotaxis protein
MQTGMKKILFIEDQIQEEENIRQLLGLSNYSVTVVADWKEGVRLAMNSHPDLILCDTRLPSIDGYDVIHALQQYPETRDIPLILLTSMEEKSDFRKAMQAGADDFLARPFEGIELLRAVEACLGRHRKHVSGEHGSSGIPPSSGADNSEDKEWHSDRREIRNYKKRTILYMEGQRASQAWYVLSGEVKTYMIHADGKQLITNICGPGDCVGCAAAVDGGSYTDNAQVLEDAALVVLSRPEFQRLLTSDPVFIRQMIRWLSRSTSAQETGLLNFAYSSLRKKVANGILSLFDSHQKEIDGKAYISISRDNLAAIVGAAPESLSRTLSDFRREHLIVITDGRIYLLDEDRLRNMVN